MTHETLRDAFDHLALAPAWVSAPVWSTLILIAAGAVGLVLHRLSLVLFKRLQPPRKVRTFFELFVENTRGPSRLAYVVFLVGAALPSVSFSASTTIVIAHMLLVGFVLLVGWTSIRASEIGATLYLHRFRTDVDDNLLARKHLTQVRILKRAADILIGLVTIGVALMTFDDVRQYGLSLFASAGAASLVVGLAARPLLTNLIAGVQIAITQPIRLEDAVIVEGEWGWIEEITSTYVVVRLWDWRRMVLPIAYFLEKPFQNWTRESGALIGSVYLYLDYSVPVQAVRDKLNEIAAQSPLCDGKVINLQVSDARDSVIELRALVSARTAPQCWDLRCEVREKLIAFVQADYPHALPHLRVDFGKTATPSSSPGARPV
ncbi:mechanosensitive ion channel family protein [Acidisoma cladoniae]|uniref:mechanosensitive ion channel family protein n=1 Tax=Acidisoma cladoniae TaxID=3040935 RepID=UPI0025513A33|nr:mechanosensitive ion channel family protein [Acidisoma sp. PAMC 29798]